MTGAHLKAIAYGNGRFVAVGGGEVLISEDGTNWRTGPADIPGGDVIFAAGRFLAVGSSIMSTADGQHWDVHLERTPAFLHGVADGNGRYVAAGENGTIMLSCDGINWTVRDSGTTEWFLDVAYGAGTFVAAGRWGTLVTSADGEFWTATRSGPIEWSATVFHDGHDFRVQGPGANFASPDGYHWDVDKAPVGWVNRVRGAGGLFVSGEGDIREPGGIFVSRDGVHWTRTSVPVYHVMHGSAYGNGRWICVGNNGLIYASDDGQTWSKAIDSPGDPEPDR